ncbi:hypothetical protein [Mariniflexile sp.]|uniref:hypothetical protein n=1 Tax=Mariniflexile sp. TaxID=1979402 RepID=UPI004047BBD1
MQGTTDKPGVICIIGTGSNSCYFDGSKIERRIISLSFLLMDDGRGNYFGKELLRAYFFDKMPIMLKDKFSKSFDLDEDVLLENLYEKENASGYLAQYAQFLIENKSDSYIEEIINNGIYKVFENLINPYHEELKKVPLYFVGTIAYFLQQSILKEANKRGYTIGLFVKPPIDNLVTKRLEKTH